MRGDGFSKTFQLKARNPDGSVGAPLDFTGGDVDAYLEDTRTNPPTKVTFTDAWVDSSIGKLTISLSEAQTTALNEYNVRWRLRVKPLGGSYETYVIGQVIPDPWPVT